MRYSKGLRREHKYTQRKKEVVGGRTLICSFDLAKHKHAYHVVDAERNVLVRGHVPHSLEGLEQLLKELETLRQNQKYDRLVFFMEGASYFWMPIASFLVRKGYKYRLVQNRAVGHERHLAGQTGHKNDPRDAAHIATLAGTLHFTFTQLPLQPAWIALRACAFEYQELVDLVTAEKNRIHAFLGTIFPGYYGVFVEPFGESSLAILRALPKVMQEDDEAVVAHVRKCFQGQNLQVQRCRAVWEYARSKDPWGYVEARAALSERIATAAARIQLLLRQQEAVREQLLAAYRQIPYQENADSLQGSSAVENAILLGILGDPKEFDDARTLVRMAGLDPGEQASGEYQGQTRITKTGRTHLRRAAVSATMAVLKSRKNPDFVRRFFRLQQRPDHPMKELQALCACAAKYLRTIWWLCVTGSHYEPKVAHHGFAEEANSGYHRTTNKGIESALTIE
jgi:transposase